MKKLNNLFFKPHYVSHLGCLDGCFEFFGMEISKPWLYGATGHGFIINIATDLCPSGPTAWNTAMIFQQSRKLGAEIDGIMAWKKDADFSQKQEQAWNLIKKAIDNNQPCYGWQIGAIPEFDIIYGYDDAGYYYQGYSTEEGSGPKPWQEVGTTGVTLLEMYRVNRIRPVNDNETIKHAFQLIVKHSQNPKDWIQYPKYKSGLEGFDQWIKAIESGTALSFGNAYNASLWAECRIMAVEFLREAQERLGSQYHLLFEKALGYYDAVARNLTKLSKIYPFSPQLPMDPIGLNDRTQICVDILKGAREAEAKGLKKLGELIDML